MIAFIAFFIPSCILVLLRDKILSIHSTRGEKAVIYFSALFAINVTAVFATPIFSEQKMGIVTFTQTDNDLAIKYLIFSVILSIVEPFMEKYLCRSLLLKRAASLAVLCILLVAVNGYLGEALTPISYGFYFNHDLEKLSENEQDIDILFIGASKTFRTFVPEIFENEMGLECVVNAGSAAQPIIGTYYQLQDLMERYHIKRVMIDVTFDRLTGEKFNVQRELLVYDRLLPYNKIRFAARAFHGTDKLYTLYTYRFRDNLEDIGEISEQKANIIANDFLAYSETEEYYADTGFIYSYDSYPNGTIPIGDNGVFSEDKINSDRLAYLNKCIELCQKNDIAVSLVTGPGSVMRIYNIDNYQGAVDFYEKLAEKYGIEYYNLNYLVGREEFLPDELMLDYNHVNGQGGHIISERFAEILLEADAGEDISDYFYHDLDDLKSDVNRIVAVNASINFNEDQAGIFITSLQNEDIVPLYRIEIKGNDQKEYTVLTDWTQESDLTVFIPYESDYEIKVSAKRSVDEEATAYQVYHY